MSVLDFPAHCRSCGLDFVPDLGAVNLIGGDATASGTMWSAGNITNCPRCGGDADIADTAVHFIPGGKAQHEPIGQKSKEMWSKLDRYNKLLEIAQRLEREEIDKAQALSEAKAVSDNASSVIGWAFNTNTLTLLIAILTLLYTFYVDLENAKADERVLDRLDQIIKVIEKGDAPDSEQRETSPSNREIIAEIKIGKRGAVRKLSSLLDKA